MILCLEAKMLQAVRVETVLHTSGNLSLYALGITGMVTIITWQAYVGE